MATARETAPQQRRSPEHERTLVAAAIGGDQAARDQAVEAFMPLIGSVAHRYHRARAVDRAELMQEGVVGLLRAVDRYDLDRDTPFWAYATFWVRQAMQQLVAEVSWPVVLSDRALRQLARARDAERRFSQDQGRAPSIAEVGADAELGPEHLDLLFAAERTPRCLDEPATDHETTSTLCEMLSDPTAQDPIDAIPSQDAARRLNEVLPTLTQRERTILTEHYGLKGEPQTLRAIAAGLGVSAERVRQIEQGALAKLRETCDWTAAPAECRPGTLAEGPARPTARSA